MDLDKEYTILIVDDDESDRRVITEAIGQMGYNLRTAKNCEEALETLEEVEIDLVLMDLTMPEISGFETTKKIRGFGQYLPIVALTAHASNENRALAPEAGMNGFVSKPVDFEELQIMLKDLLESVV